MGNICVFAKWDLKKKDWRTPVFEEYGRSFAISSYATINNSGDMTNYIISAQGTRVEDHSKNFKTIKESKAHIDNIIKYFENKTGKYSIKYFMMDADSPIIEDAKLLAKYIDNLAILPTTNSINIIGLSKCSAMNFYVPRFFNKVESFEKTNMFNIATPYTGTRLASPQYFYPDILKLITSKVGDNHLAEMIYSKLIDVYEGVSSNSHMDYDIAMPGGISSEKFSVYDKDFIKNIFSTENVQAIKQLNYFQNIITGIDKNTWKEAMATLNFTGLGLCLLDDLFFDNKSDGMVFVEAQREVEKVLDIKSHILKSTHHDTMGIKRAVNEILGLVEDNINETNEKKVFYKKNK